MRATYSPEDNKLRIYPDSVRVDSELTPEEYARFKASGYKWAAKQECFVCPRWTPTAEDWALRLADSGEIEDEDYSPEERSADRAERFEGYRDKRADEAGASADAFAAGPQVFGNQSQARAERQARRHDRHRTNAVSQWGKAEYWHQRTRGVIAHALFKSSARVRRGRLLTLEADQRKHEKELSEYRDKCAKWRKVLDLDGADTCVVLQDGEKYYIDREKTKLAALLAFHLAGNGLECLSKYKHPRTGKEDDLCDLLRDSSDPITAREAAALWLARSVDVDAEGSRWRRWSDHYARRIEYEKAMLEAEGGLASEAEIEPGGFILTGNRTGSVFTSVATGWKQVVSVSRSPVTKRVTSVKVWGTSNGYTRESGYKEYAVKPALVSVNVERLGADHYRPPTDEERAAFVEAEKARKKAEKATKPSAPQLLNPTDEDAQRLQDAWNDKARRSFEECKREGRAWSDFVPSVVLRMTQAKYSDMSKGSYARAETVSVRTDNACIPSRWDKTDSPTACKVRKTYGVPDWGFTGKAPSVVVISDKPQKPLPLDWEAIEAARATVSAS